MDKSKRARMATEKMTAVRVSQFGGPKVLRIETDVPVPVPTDSQVLVEIKSAGVNLADTYVRSNAFFDQPSLPFTPGFDGAGMVKMIGKKVTKFKVGDRVFVIKAASGSYAEYATAEESMVGHLSDSLSFQQGAAIGIPYFTALKALCILGKNKMKPEYSALIHGASGAVGNACVQIAVSRGLAVYGTASSEEGIDLVMKLGAKAAFNHKGKGYYNQIMEATDEKGPDIIVEMLANANLDSDLNIINDNGVIVIVGGGSGRTELHPGLFTGKQCQVVGMSILRSSQDEWSEMQSLVCDGMKKGWLQPHVGKEYKLEEAQLAHNDLTNNSGACGKKVFII